MGSFMAEVISLTPVNGKKILLSFFYPHDGDKYLGGICNHIISNCIPQFFVFYSPQGGTELSDRFSGVRH